MTAPSAIGRRRTRLGLLMVVTIASGMASREFPGLVPRALGKYPGDALWAQAVYWAGAFMRPSWSIARVSGFALAVSDAAEASQLYQADWIRDVRASTLSHLLLGSAFSWIDVLAYAIGICLSMLIDWCLRQIYA